MENNFKRVLQSLGHLYMPEAPNAEVAISETIRHLSWHDAPTQPLCRRKSSPRPKNARFLMLAELFGDLNCPKCREAVMLDGRSITKRSIMLDAVNSIISIEQMFIEAIYWKMHRSEESPINPDPDGVLGESLKFN